MKIITFNIRCANDADGHSIDERAPRLKTILDKYNGDIVGFQEVTPYWFDLIQKDYSDEYDIFNKYRSKDFAPESVTIMWKKDKFTCIDKGYFWFSDTPWIESMGADKLCPCKRICQWVLLSDKETKKEFYYFNLHFGFGDEYQVASVNLIKSTTDILNTESIIITGDFNMIPSSEAYKEMTKHYSDVNALTKNYCGTTYHEYGKVEDKHIDFCFVDKNIKPIDYFIIDDKIDGGYPSDHYGILIEVGVI